MKLTSALVLIVILFNLTGVSCTGNDSDDTTDDPTLRPEKIPEPVNIGYQILAQYPKDTGAYTQGLEIYNGKLYESTGDYENSSIRIVDRKTGNVEKKHLIGKGEIFGEGLTILNDRLYQLTWVSNIVYVYNAGDITKPVKTLNWPREGWGITNNGKELIISDGTDVLYFTDTNLNIIRTIPVKSYKGSITEVNELEYIDGYIYANVYQQNYIIKVDPSNGHIVGVIVLENLLQNNERVPGRTDVLNGIAYDSSAKTILVTGKRWPKLFEIKLN